MRVSANCIWGTSTVSTELIVANVTAGYRQMHILKDVSFAVRSGERLSILGRNGAGKTTLLLAIMGLCRLHSGQISLDGASISVEPTYRRANAGLGLVPQTRDVFKSLTVEENLLSGLKRSGERDVSLAYELFPRLKERRRNYGGQLSGGEQQMLSIARTLVGRPRILLLDEPLEGLAPVICEELMLAFAKLASVNAGLSIVLVEQHLNVALDFCDKAIVLDRGRVAFEGSSKELLASGSLEQALGLNVFPDLV